MTRLSPKQKVLAASCALMAMFAIAASQGASPSAIARVLIGLGALAGIAVWFARQRGLAPQAAPGNPRLALRPRRVLAFAHPPLHVTVTRLDADRVESGAHHLPLSEYRIFSLGVTPCYAQALSLVERRIDQAHFHLAIGFSLQVMIEDLFLVARRGRSEVHPFS